MEKKRYVVKLGHLELGLRSYDGEAYIDGLSAYVNKLLDGFKSSSDKISDMEAYALSALSAADELFKLRSGLDELKAELESVRRELSDSLGRAMMLEAELHQSRVSQDSLKEETARLEKTLKDDGNREERLKETLNILSYELRKPHADRVYEKDLNEAARLLEEMIRLKKQESPSYEPGPEDERRLGGGLSSDYE